MAEKDLGNGIFNQIVARTKEAIAKKKAERAAIDMRAKMEAEHARCVTKVNDFKRDIEDEFDDLVVDPTAFVEKYNVKSGLELDENVDRYTAAAKNIERRYAVLFGDLGKIDPIS